MKTTIESVKLAVLVLYPAIVVTIVILSIIL